MVFALGGMGVKSVQIAEREVKIAASTFYPQVQAQASVARDGNTPSLDVRDFSGATTPETRMFGVTATLQAWDWGSTYFGMQSARETVKKLQADLAKMRLDVGYEVKTYYLNIQDAAKRIAVARTALEASKEGFRMVFEVLTFRSLFRNTAVKLDQNGPKVAYSSDKWLWLFALAFHYSFLVILIRHLRFFTNPVPMVPPTE